MALAILELSSAGGAAVRFKVDTGTNLYYQLKIGRGIRPRNGIDWVDQVYASTPVRRNPAGGGLLSTAAEIAIPARLFERGTAYVQLFSFKSPQGRAPGFSRVIRLPMGVGAGIGRTGLVGSMSTEANMKTEFVPARAVPCRTAGEVYARQASVDDLLAGVLKMAGPVVASLLKKPEASGGTATTGAGNGGADAGQAGTLAGILQILLSALGGAPVSQPQSVENRFMSPGGRQLAKPFIFGIDDALIGALAGPIIQALPQLMNSANQRRVDLKRADNKLISDILSDVNRRLLMDQLLQMQKQPGQSANEPGVAQLLQLLQQSAAAPPPAGSSSLAGTSAAAAPPAAPGAVNPASSGAAISGAQSREAAPENLSKKAVVTFATAEPQLWNGAQKILFSKTAAIQLKIQLTVPAPAPKTPLPKAIIKLILKENASGTVVLEKVYKLRDVAANSPLALAFTVEELARVPVNKPVSVLAQFRWIAGGREWMALGSTEIVFVNEYYVREQGGSGTEERELVDMQRYRPFWNKVWEAPPLDGAGSSNNGKKYVWDLDVNAKYSVLLSVDKEANGLMQTKVLRTAQDPESTSERVEGRMKGGIELSISELNKLLPLWEGQSPWEHNRLEALMAVEFAQRNGGEFLHRCKLKGRAGERGMVWVIPVFKLGEVVLGKVARCDEAGQVVASTEEKMSFPTPVSARVIGLKSQA